jgi:hypothetical protein
MSIKLTLIRKLNYMKTHELNRVSSSAVARLENFESSRFLSLARTAVTQYRNRKARLIPTRNVHRHSPFSILNSSFEMAGLKTLEKPGFLTPSQMALTHPSTPRSSRGHEAHYIHPCGSPHPTALIRNHPNLATTHDILACGGKRSPTPLSARHWNPQPIRKIPTTVSPSTSPVSRNFHILPSFLLALSHRAAPRLHWGGRAPRVPARAPRPSSLLLPCEIHNDFNHYCEGMLACFCRDSLALPTPKSLKIPVMSRIVA